MLSKSSPFGTTPHFGASSNSHLAAICLSALAASIVNPSIVLDAAPVSSFSFAAGETERDAELLRVGSYPTKNLTVTEADLDHIVARFSADSVPIRVQHTPTPLDPFGTVKKLWRDGGRLLGRVSFDALVVPFLASRPVKALSCGLDRLADGGLVLSELSLVMQGHVPTAALLSADDAAAKIAQLEAKFAALDADARILELKRAGKIFPAVELHARALLSAPAGASIQLADGNSQSVADAAFALLSALPSSVKFTETLPNGKRVNLYGGPGGAAASTEEDPDNDDDGPELTPAQVDYCTNVLKVDPKKVRQTMKTTQRIGGV